MSERVVTFMYTGDIDLSESDIWPDGDAPENWTLQDVQRVINECGGRVDILNEWGIDDYVRLDIAEAGEVLHDV